MRLLAALFLAFLVGCTSTRFAGSGSATQTVKAGGANIVYSGATSFDARRLNDVIADDLARFAVAPNRRAVLDDAAYALSRFYQSQGFPSAQVEFEFDESDASEARFVVREGPRVLVAALKFAGNSEFSDAELARFYEAPRDGDAQVYVESLLGDAKSAMIAAYVARGYAKVEIDDPHIAFDHGGARATVEFAIRERRVFHLRTARFDGDIGDARPALDAIVDSIRSAGDPYTPALSGQLAARASDVFGNQGYPEPRVRTTEERFDEGGGVELAFSVERGQRVVIKDVVVRGNRRVATALIRSRIKFDAGKPWSTKDERDSLTGLYRTGLFSTVRITLEGDGEERTLAVEVAEASSREFYVEPGYGSYERLRLGLGWRDKDWLGSGRILNVEGTISELAQRAQVSLTDLHFLDSDIEAAASGFGGQRREPSFDTTEVGGALTFTRRFATSPDEPRIQAILAYQFRRSGVSNVDANVSAPAEADVNISSLVATPSYDSRDDVFVPHKGSFLQVSVEYSSSVTGSQLDFVRSRWTATHFFPIGPRNVLGISWRGGIIAPFATTDTIPLQERFFNGGENTVRAFREDELGPLDANGAPLGGEGFNVASIELRRQLFVDHPNFEVGFFVDVGNVEPLSNEFWSFDGIRWGPGVGLRYLLPVGPIRVDLGFNPDTQDDESPLVLHVSVGMSF